MRKLGRHSFCREQEPSNTRSLGSLRTSSIVTVFRDTRPIIDISVSSGQRYLLIDNITIAHTITVYYEQSVTDAHGYLIANIIEYLSIEKISDHQFRSDLDSLDHGPLGILSVSYWLNLISRLVCHG